MDRIIFADGLCEPNSGGVSCWGIVVVDATGQVVAERCGILGQGDGMTNNRAEYCAVINALYYAGARGWHGALIYTDSQLVARQVSGDWGCSSETLKPLYEMARAKLAEIGARVEWIPRESNIRADALTRQALRSATRRAA